MVFIDERQFAQAIQCSYAGMTDAVAQGYAKLWLGRVDSSLLEALSCWIEQRPVPNVEFGEYSIQRILNLRANGDYLQAILLLSDYIRDPDVGRAKIMAPQRGKR